MKNWQWWQKVVFYQIYPRSFADSNGDGIGDLQGIIQKLDYLKDLGIGAIWMSPHYPSPQMDCGYDIADYQDVAPEYGTLADFQRLLNEAHQRDIRIVLDMVLNHTSDQHTWFEESRSDRNNPKRDWYIWRDGKGDGPPNNWNSTFGGSAWEYDPQTDQYYYHFFFKQQPDLNWRNPEVKEAMWKAMRFWLDMGVDGFRLDAIGTIFEHPGLPDHTSPYSLPELHQISRRARNDHDQHAAMLEWEKMFQYQHEQPGMHELLKELRQLVNGYPERVLIGETDDISYYGNGHDELHMVFNFPLMKTDQITANRVRGNQKERLDALPDDAWPCNTLGNHDSPRIYSRYGNGLHNSQIARQLLTLMLTLKGTPVLYNGEEIGMTDFLLKDLRQFRDNLGVWNYNIDVNYLGLSHEEALDHAARATRDACRTPFQWSQAPNAGFSPENTVTWLPVNPNYLNGVNVANQDFVPGSLLNDYRTLIKLRSENPALVVGDYQILNGDAQDVLAFLRVSVEDRQTCLILMNMSSETVHQSDLGYPDVKLEVMYTNQNRPHQMMLSSLVDLSPFEILIASI